MEQPFITDASLLIDYDIMSYRMMTPEIEILRQNKIISPSTYYFLKTSNSDIYNSFISDIYTNRTLRSLVINAIKDTNNKFLVANNILDTNVLEITGNNIIIKDSLPKVARIDQIEFILENQFSNFINIESIRLYSINDMLGYKYMVHGFTQYQVQLHQKMIDVILQAITILSTNGAMPALQFIRQLYNDYINYKLPVEYYRAFNLSSSYSFKSNLYKYNVFYVDEKDKTSLDISYNKRVIEKLFSIFVQLSFLMM